MRTAAWCGWASGSDRVVDRTDWMMAQWQRFPRESQCGGASGHAALLVPSLVCTAVRNGLAGLALAFFPIRNGPDKTTGEFYLSLAHIKVRALPLGSAHQGKSSTSR